MEISDSVRKFLTEEVPLLQNSSDFDVNSSLIASGVLDSIDVIKLISFLEQSFDIAIEARDVQAGHLETISSIEKFVRSRASR